MTQLENEQLLRFITAALAEDAGDGDHTSLSTIPQHAVGEAQLIIKEPGILAGVEEALAVFREVSDTLSVTTFKSDGDTVEVGDVVLTVKGSVHGILLSERLVLNIMQHERYCNGNASHCRRYSRNGNEGAGYAQNNAAAPVPRKKSGSARRRGEPSVRIIRYDADKGQPRRLRRRDNERHHARQ